MNTRQLVVQVFCVLLLGFLWGMNWPAVKFILTEVPPLTIRGVAFPIAAVLLAIIALLTRQKLLPHRRDWIPMMLTGIFIIFGFNVLATFGQTFTEASKAAIIAYTMPAMTGVLAAVFLREKLSQRSIVALAVGMLGLAVLASEDITALVAQPLGVIIMLLAALLWSIGNVMLKARDWSIAPLALTVWFFVVSSIMVWPLVIVFEQPWLQKWPSAAVVFTLGYHVLGPMVICYTIWTVMVDRLPATIAALSTLTAPVVGVFGAALLVSEPLSWQKIISLAMIVLSVALTFGTASKSGTR